MWILVIESTTIGLERATAKRAAYINTRLRCFFLHFLSILVLSNWSYVSSCTGNLKHPLKMTHQKQLFPKHVFPTCNEINNPQTRNTSTCATLIVFWVAPAQQNNKISNTPMLILQESNITSSRDHINKTFDHV